MIKRFASITKDMIARAHAGSRAAAMRAFCLECCGGASREVENCTARVCPLYPFRRGKFDKKDVFGSG